jgi:hypothetical protein
LELPEAMSRNGPEKNGEGREVVRMAVGKGDR